MAQNSLPREAVLADELVAHVGFQGGEVRLNALGGFYALLSEPDRNLIRKCHGFGGAKQGLQAFVKKHLGGKLQVQGYGSDLRLLLTCDLPPPSTHDAAAAASALDALPPFSLPRLVLHYDTAELERVICAEIAQETVVGLDIEWKPNFVKGQRENRVALIQLATAHLVILVPIVHLRCLPPALVKLLSSRAVWKVGCGVHGDAKKLSNEYGLEVRSVCELGPMAVRLQREEGVRFPKLAHREPVGQGLKSMAAALGQVLVKPKHVTLSNWESKPLSIPQQRYAAQDAYVSYWLALCCNHLHAHARGNLMCGPMGCWVAEQVDACKCRQVGEQLAACEVSNKSTM